MANIVNANGGNNVCPQCGAKIDPEATECKYCGTTIMQQAAPQNANATAPVQQTLRNNPSNPLLGKEYEFSGNDIALKGRWGIKYNVTVGEDRLNFETVPAKKNKLPAVMLEDIMAIQESFYMRTANIVLAILGLIFCLMTGSFWWLLLTAIVVLLYRERKMKIHLRNGYVLTIYSGDKESDMEFIEDMRKITKIK